MLVVGVFGQLLPAVGQWIDFGVMEESPLAVTPREGLRADPHVFVWLELREMEVLVMFLLHEVCVQTRQTDGRDAHQEEHLLPQTRVWLVSRVTARSRHPTHG